MLSFIAKYKSLKIEKPRKGLFYFFCFVEIIINEQNYYWEILQMSG